MDNTITVANGLGHQITVFRDDHIGKSILKHGLYERTHLTLLLTVLARIEQPVVLDIGANIGNHTLAFATRARQVHAFEPIPRIFDVLSGNIAQNELRHVAAHRVALSDTNGSDTIYMAQDGNVGSSSFEQRGGVAVPVTVDKVVGDDFLAALGVDRVDFIKMDVEAHEAFVLRGLARTLRRDRPVITMEWNDPLTVQRLTGSAELAFLVDHYDIHVLASNHDKTWWSGRPLAYLRRKLAKIFVPRRGVLTAFDASKVYTNLLLIPKGRASLVEHIAQRR